MATAELADNAAEWGLWMGPQGPDGPALPQGGSYEHAQADLAKLAELGFLEQGMRGKGRVLGVKSDACDLRSAHAPALGHLWSKIPA